MRAEELADNIKSAIQSGKVITPLEEEQQTLSTKLEPTVIPTDERAKPLFSTIRQGTVTNALTKTIVIENEDSTKHNTRVDVVTGDATITTGSIIIRIPEYLSLKGLKTSTYKLFDILTIILTESGAKSPTVILSVDDYMKRRGLKDRKEARKQLIGDLQVLYKTSLEWEEKLGSKTIPYAGVNIADSWRWLDGKKSSVVFTFGQTFYNALKGYPVMPYPNQLLELDTRKYPNGYHLHRKIAEHKNMNVGKDNEDIISVKTLLEAAPYLPSYDDVMKTDRAIGRRIIEPFERDMDALKKLLTWEYCLSKKKPVEKADVDSYEYFSSLYVLITWKDYPDQTDRLKRKAARIEKAKTAEQKDEKPGKKAQ